MKISLNWLKELIDFEMSPEKLDEALTMLGIEVEGIENPAKKLDGFYVAKVVEREKHPDADKLSVCKVNIGGEDLQVICGAPNVAAGQKVVLGTSGATVPSAGFKLVKRKIRGIESNGMICSQSELEVGEDASGIWVLPESATIGLPIAEYLGINDVIFEISVTPNRADCLSHIGIAREIAALTGNSIRYPENSIQNSNLNINDFAKVIIEDNEKCPRYTAKLVRNCKITESPDWLKTRLQTIGLRPINAAVDITNLILMESGQPLHGFDFDKINAGTIVVKTANDKDKFTTLDSKERQLDNSMLMICDAEKYVAIAGVMGGQNSEIAESTTNILIESAYFLPSTVRKTSKKLALQSDSSYRFERGVDFENVPLACERAAFLIAELTGGEVCDGLIDIYPKPISRNQVEFRFERARKIIGADIDNNTMLDIIKSLNFEILNSNPDSLTLSAPAYRVDISLEIDVIEEIARLYNYDNINSDFSSKIDFGLQKIKEELQAPSLRNPIRQFFVNQGFTEILTQNQTDPKSIGLFGLEPVKISNPLGEELSLMRTSLINSSLKVISHNIRNGIADIKLFEIGKIFRKTEDANSFIPGITESENLIIALTGNNAPLQWGIKSKEYDFYDIKGIAENFGEFFGIENIKFSQNTNHPLFSTNSLSLTYKKKLIATIGEIKKNVLKHYDIDQKVYIAEINLNEIYSSKLSKNSYQPISHFPAVSRDLAFILAKDIPAGDVLNAVKQVDNQLMKDVVLFDVYDSANLGENRKSLAFGLTFRANDRTLIESEIELVINKVINKIETQFSAQLRKN
jgi:phenylalanyl-tRNA synthetase beta chain